MEDEYLVIQCPACERKVKARSGAALRLGCPYCKEPIEVAPSIDVGAPEDEEDQVERPPLAFRKIEKTAATTPQEGHTTAGNSNHASPGKGEKRRRRRSTETPDWDDAGERSTSRRNSGSEKDDDSSEFLEMDPDSPGGVRLKRVRRKKLASGKDKVFRVLIAITLVAGACTAGFIVYAAVFKTAGVIAQDNRIQEDATDEVTQAAAVKTITVDLTSDEEGEALAIISDFLSSESIEEKLKFVRDPSRVGPLMENWHQKGIELSAPAGTELEILRRGKSIDNERFFIRLYVDIAGVGGQMFFLEQSQDGMKLDWETASGYQQLTLSEFKEQRPTKPVEFRVKLKPSDFYNFDFNAEEHLAIALSYPGRPEFKLTGYALRDSEEGKRIAEMFARDIYPSMIVHLNYPESEIKDDTLVELSAIVADTWLR